MGASARDWEGEHHLAALSLLSAPSGTCDVQVTDKNRVFQDAAWVSEELGVHTGSSCRLCRLVLGRAGAGEGRRRGRQGWGRGQPRAAVGAVRAFMGPAVQWNRALGVCTGCSENTSHTVFHGIVTAGLRQVVYQPILQTKKLRHGCRVAAGFGSQAFLNQSCCSFHRDPGSGGPWPGRPSFPGVLLLGCVA